jgi:hypothetical protein
VLEDVVGEVWGWAGFCGHHCILPEKGPR